MATLTNAFQINGVIDTSRNVLANINDLTTAAGAWATYDITTGLWSVIINRAGSSVFSFTDSNIIGSINVSGTGINEAYNKVTVQFPHKDLRDQTDYVDLVIPIGDRFPNEIDNTLQIDTNLFNDPVQAAYIAQVELKQSRVDRVVEFRTDYTALGLRAGDIIDITNDAYGFNSKLFRIVKITEDDTQDGGIELSISALEYDVNIYNSSGLIREERSKKTGIVPKAANTAITNSDNNATTNNVTNSLLDPSNLAVIALLMNALTRNGNSSLASGAIGVTPLVYAFKTSFLSAIVTDGSDDDISLGYYKIVPLSGIYKIKYNINWGGGANGSATNGALKNSTISYRINGGPIIEDGDSATGDLHVQIYEDHIIEGVLALNAGDRIDFCFRYATDWPTAVFLVNAELLLLQRA
jgi:hypothetical protein